MTPEELLAWRRARGLNQVQVAEALGVRRQTVIAWERRKHPVPDDLYLRLEKLTMPHDVAQREDENTGRIIQLNYPALFDPVPGTFDRFVRGKLHPHSLARRGLLGWPGCTWRNASLHGQYTDPHEAILRTEHYAGAIEDMAVGVEYHPVVAELLKQERGTYHPVIAARFKLNGALPERSEMWEPWDGLHYWAEMPPVIDD